VLTAIVLNASATLTTDIQFGSHVGNQVIKRKRQRNYTVDERRDW